MLRKWTPHEKHVKHQNFLTYFGLLLSLECSDEVLQKSVESAYLIKLFAQSGVFLQKAYAGFLLVKVPSQLAPRLIKPQTNETTGPLSVCDNRSRFPGKSNALQHVIFFFISLSQVSAKYTLWL